MGPGLSARILLLTHVLADARDRYATGGSTHNELWEAPGQLGHTLGHGGMRHEHAESCTTHNMVRLVGMLLRASGGALAYADFVERALLNGVLGTQRGTEPGAMLYFMPLGSGVSKRKPQSWRHTGWSTPFGDFWCCQGTGIEAFARLAEHIFMEHRAVDNAPPELFVLQLIPARLQWRRAGLALSLEADLPGAVHPDAAANLTLRVTKASAVGARAALTFRVPSWAAAPTATLQRVLPRSRDGHVEVELGADGPAVRTSSLGPVEAGTLLRVERTWREGDALTLALPTALRTSYVVPAARPPCSGRLLQLRYAVLRCAHTLGPRVGAGGYPTTGPSTRGSSRCSSGRWCSRASHASSRSCQASRLTPPDLA